MPNLKLNNAEDLRVKLTNRQQKSIVQIYKKASQSVAQQAKKLENKNNVSSILRQRYLKALQEQIDTQMKQAQADLEGMITDNMVQVSQQVSQATIDFLNEVGLSVEGAFSHVPDQIVKNIATGKIYEGKWSLSSALWGERRKVQTDVQKVIAQGVAENKSTYEIAKDIERYVNPSARKDWEWSKVYPGTNKKVDYSAQRLARTLVSHAYQQSLVLTVKDNPFVTGIRWHAAHSARVCPICAERDGQVYSKTELPLDHPNGMCYFTAEIPDSMESIADRIADWAQGKADSELDQFAKSLFPNMELKEVRKKTTKSASTRTKPTTKSSTKSAKSTSKPATKTIAKAATKTTSKKAATSVLEIGSDEWITKSMKNMQKKITDTFGESAWSTFIEDFKQRPKEAQAWIARFQGALDGFIEDRGKNYCVRRTISWNFSGDSKGLHGKKPFTTFYHEFGHMIDHQMWKGVDAASADSKFGKGLYKLLEKEYNALTTSSGSLRKEIRSELRSDDRTSGVQDIISGLSKDTNRVKWGHTYAYWTRKEESLQWTEVTNEAMAHFNSCFCDSELSDIMKKYFPQSYDYYLKEFIQSDKLYKKG